MAKKSQTLDYDNLFDSFSTAIEEELSVVDDSLDIIRFVEEEVDLGITLTIQQKCVLKAFYNLPLTEEEESIIQFWIAQGRSTWNPEETYQSLILESGRRCLSKDTLIYSTLGLSTFQELLQGNILVDDEDTENTNYKISVSGQGNLKPKNMYHLGKVETNIVTTEAGYEIEGTVDHKIRILNTEGKFEWVYIKNLTKGDRICIDRNPKVFRNGYLEITAFHEEVNNLCKPINQHNYLTEDLGYVLGTLVGDGTWNTKSATGLTSHKEDIPHFIKEWEKVFPKNELKITKKRGSKAQTLQFHSFPYRRFLDNLGFTLGVDRSSKDIPWSIRQSPKSVQASFISGLYDTDGCAENNGQSITFCTSSNRLAKTLQVMLLGFGIISKILTKPIEGKDYYIVYILGKESREIFAKEINFKLPRKKDKLDSYVKIGKKDGSCVGQIPYQYEWLQKACKSLPSARGKQAGSHHGVGTDMPTYKSDFRKIVGNAIKSSGLKEQLSSDKLNKLVNTDVFNLLDKDCRRHFFELYSHNYYYDTVQSIKKSEADCYDFEIPQHHHYVANGFVSHNSGKSSLAAVIATYEFYVLCKMPSPQIKYGIATSTPISILVLATTATQAKKTIFKTVTGVVKNTRYFQKLESQGKLFIGKEEVAYDDKLLYIYSGNSQSGSQVGGTMKALVMDEVARFKDSDGVSNAHELWSNLGIATTTFGKDARRVAISSAWFEGDAIQTMYNDTKVDPTSLGIQTRSWDLNPIHAARDNPVVVSEYAKDPVAAAIEFEGIRPAAVDPFLSAEEIKRACTGKTCIHYKTYVENDNGYDLEKIKITSVGKRSSGTVLHVDPAITRDSYAMAFGHSEFQKGNQIVVIDGLLAWEPKHNTEVSIIDVQDAILHIHRYRPLVKFSADHYNSAETIQRIRKYGIKCEVQNYSNSLQLSMYDLLRQLLHENRLILPNDSPLTSLLQRELSKVQLIRGMKIDHIPGESKDLADAVASVCWHLASRIDRDKLNNKGSFSSARMGSNHSSGSVDKTHSSAYTNSNPASHRVLSNAQGLNKWKSSRSGPTVPFG